MFVVEKINDVEWWGPVVKLGDVGSMDYEHLETWHYLCQICGWTSVTFKPT